MAHFRVDRLSGIKILPAGFTPDENPLMWRATPTRSLICLLLTAQFLKLELLCENKLMKTIIDHYGEAVPTRTYDENTLRQTLKSTQAAPLRMGIQILWGDSDSTS